MPTSSFSHRARVAAFSGARGFIVRCLPLCLALLTVGFGFSSRADAAPTLRASDLVVIDYQSDTVDQFALLVLAPIPANSVIFLTDAQWLSNGNISVDNLGNTETLLKWTTPATIVPAGTVVRFVPLPLSVTTGSLAVVNSTINEPLSLAGDQLIIYQTVDDQSSLLLSNIKRLNAAGEVESGPIYSFNLDNSTANTVAYSTSVNGFGTVGGSHASGITTTGSFTPPSSTVFDNSGDTNRSSANAFGLGSFFFPAPNTDWDNVRYSGPVTSADKPTWLLRVHNVANWIGTEALPWGSSAGTLTDVSAVTVAIADTTAPVFDIAPATSSATASGFALSASLDEAGTIFYVVVSDGDCPPAASQVVAGENAGGSAALVSGNKIVSTSPFFHSFTVAGLSIGTAYDVYIVARDDEGTPNLMASAVKVDATTAAPAAPSVTTPTQAGIGETSATLGGNVTSDGGAAITARGVVVAVTSINANPTLGGTGSTRFTDRGTTGVFTVSASGLTSGTGYSYRAYATNSAGTTYTSADTFTTIAPDTTAPTVVSVARQNPTTQAISSGAVVFRVTYSEPVKNVAAARFAVVPVGTTSSIVGSVTGVTDAGNATAYDVAVTISSGSGEFRLHVID